MQTIYVLSLLSFLAATVTLPAQQLSQSAKRTIDSLFAEYTEPGSPGCALAVYRDGAILYSNGYGLADIEHDIPMSPETVFDIGSTSKQFTAACLLLLQQQGAISLEDDVRTYIPELPDYGTVITIRQLLNHTSGIRDYIGLMSLAGIDIDDVTTPDQALDAIVRQKGLDFTPGSDHSYSNSGYFLASLIVERVSGMTLREFAAANIFGPLGMVHSGYVDDHTTVVKRRADAYDRNRDGTYARNISYWEQNGDGGVFTSVKDLLLWDENFYRHAVGGAVMIEGLTERGILSDGDTLDYALGLFHDDFHGIPAISHGGAWGGYRAELIRIPSRHTSVATLCNCGQINPSVLSVRVLEALYPDDVPEEAVADGSEPTVEHTAVELNPGAFETMAGEYALDVQPNFRLTFYEEDGQYFSRATGQSEIAIRPFNDSSFFNDDIGIEMVFHREADGSVARLTLTQGADYSAHRVEPFTIDESELSDFEGLYYSPELDIEYRVAVAEGRLTAKHGSRETIRFTPVGTDSFTGDGWMLNRVRFERDDAGDVTSMLLSAGRIDDMRFERRGKSGR